MSDPCDYNRAIEQKDLADRLGLKQGTLSRYFADRIPRLPIIESLELAVGYGKGAALVKAGYVKTPGTEEAIMADPALDAEAQRFVIQAYRADAKRSRARKQSAPRSPR